MENEEWRDIPKWEGYYQVSSLGRVRSLGRIIDRKDGKTCPVKERILKATLVGGYMSVPLMNKGYIKRIYVHQLVAMAFLGHEPCGFEKVINHKNFLKTDNRVENLEIVSNRDNSNRKHLPSTSEFIGVSWNKCRMMWHASISLNGVRKYLGRYKTEKEASDAYERALMEINSGQEISFKPRKKISKYAGVTFHKGSGKWHSYINVGGKHKYLGQHTTEEEAHDAYQEALKNKIKSS